MEQKKRGRRRHLKHLVGALGASILLFTGFMGFAHTKTGRPALVWLERWAGKNSACPLGFDRTVSASERTLERRALARAHAGRPATSELSVLSFELGRSTKSEIESWVTKNGGSCKPAKSGFELECVGAFFDSDKTSLWLEFDENDRLVAARGSESYSTPESAIAAFARLRGRLGTRGLSVVGQSAVAKLRTGLLAQVAETGDYSNLSSSARVTNMGDHFAVTHRAVVF